MNINNLLKAWQTDSMKSNWSEMTLETDERKWREWRREMERFSWNKCTKCTYKIFIWFSVLHGFFTHLFSCFLLFAIAVSSFFSFISFMLLFLWFCISCHYILILFPKKYLLLFAYKHVIINTPTILCHHEMMKVNQAYAITERPVLTLNIWGKHEHCGIKLQYVFHQSLL